MELQNIILLIIVGIIAGFINTLAGGGSLLSLPVLIFMGLPANIANGSNRIAIFFQNLVSIRNFKKHKILDFKEGIKIAFPAIIGALFGAQLALSFDETIMKRAIAVILVIMIVILALKPEKYIYNLKTKEKKFGIFQFIIFFCIGIYGGFIQAGVGFFILIGLVLGCGYDLVKANAIKSFIIFLYTPFALFIFIKNGQVNYLFGFTITIGNVIGAYIASMLAIKKGVVFVRYVLLIALIVSSLKLMGLF